MTSPFDFDKEGFDTADKSNRPVSMNMSNQIQGFPVNATTDSKSRPYSLDMTLTESMVVDED